MHEVNRGSGMGVQGATFSPQLPRIVLHGDRLDPLLDAEGVALDPVHGPELDSSTIRAAVIGIDGRHLPTRQLRKRLSRERLEFARTIARFPRVRHMIIVLQIEREAERAATRILVRAAHLAHVEFEMRWSSDICVTGIVITDDTDAKVIIRRLNERTRGTPIEGSHVISARRIFAHSISATAAEDLL